MPIYEYQCQKCGYKFEKLIRGNEEIKCPKCKDTNLKKLISSFNSASGELNTSSGSSSCPSGTCPLV